MSPYCWQPGGLKMTKLNQLLHSLLQLPLLLVMQSAVECCYQCEQIAFLYRKKWMVSMIKLTSLKNLQLCDPPLQPHRSSRAVPEHKQSYQPTARQHIPAIRYIGCSCPLLSREMECYQDDYWIEWLLHRSHTWVLHFLVRELYITEGHHLLLVRWWVWPCSPLLSCGVSISLIHRSNFPCSPGHAWSIQASWLCILDCWCCFPHSYFSCWQWPASWAVGNTYP